MNQKVTIYTDGACLGNPGKGGWAGIIFDGNEQIELSEGYKHTTNNRMEILAAIKSIERTPVNSEIELFSDSKLLVDAFNQRWIVSWQKKGWKKSDNSQVLNQDLWKRILPLVNERKVKFIWVKGHADNEFNERCDVLAKNAAMQDSLLTDEPYEGIEKGTLNIFNESKVEEKEKIKNIINSISLEKINSNFIMKINSQVIGNLELSDLKNLKKLIDSYL